VTYLTDSEIAEYKTVEEMTAFLDTVEDALVLNGKGFSYMRKLMRDHGYENVKDPWWLKKGCLGKYKGIKLWHSWYKDQKPGEFGEVGEPHNVFENGFPSD